ncbi:MAG: diacylglycerol/lipid kinase family protein [Phototrophicaceae bacterium]
MNLAKTLVIVNPYADSGRAYQRWQTIHPLFQTYFPNAYVVITQSAEEVTTALQAGMAQHIEQVIAVGGDGTNNSVLNALLTLGIGQTVAFGVLPMGTGFDFTRHLQIPNDLVQAVLWLSNASPQLCDVGQLVADDSPPRYFLNIASIGLSGEVNIRMQPLTRRYPWTFLAKTVESILFYRQPNAQIWVNGEQWYSGKLFLLAVANGSTFGRGMKIAPSANIHDQLFEVVLVKGVSIPIILSALWRVYNGSHLTHPAVQYRRGGQVEVRIENHAENFEVDGELGCGQSVRYSLLKDAIRLLVATNNNRT